MVSTTNFSSNRGYCVRMVKKAWVGAISGVKTMTGIVISFVTAAVLTIALNIWLGIKEGQIAERSEDKE